MHTVIQKYNTTMPYIHFQGPCIMHFLILKLALTAKLIYVYILYNNHVNISLATTFDNGWRSIIEADSYINRKNMERDETRINNRN